MNKHLEKFKELFGYGSFRPYKNGYEVRVSDLDNSYHQAEKLIEKHKLKISLSNRDIQLRSFVVSPSN